MLVGEAFVTAPDPSASVKAFSLGARVVTVPELHSRPRLRQDLRRHLGRRRQVRRRRGGRRAGLNLGDVSAPSRRSTKRATSPTRRKGDCFAVARLSRQRRTTSSWSVDALGLDVVQMHGRLSDDLLSNSCVIGLCCR